MNAEMPVPKPLLTARKLTKNFVVGKTIRPGSGRVLHAVDSIDLDVYPTETLGLVGESGSGKSTLGRCLTRLYDITAGDLTFDGQDIAKADAAALKPVRRKMQMISTATHTSFPAASASASALRVPLPWSRS